MPTLRSSRSVLPKVVLAAIFGILIPGWLGHRLWQQRNAQQAAYQSYFEEQKTLKAATREFYSHYQQVENGTDRQAVVELFGEPSQVLSETLKAWTNLGFEAVFDEDGNAQTSTILGEISPEDVALIQELKQSKAQYIDFVSFFGEPQTLWRRDYYLWKLPDNSAVKVTVQDQSVIDKEWLSPQATSQAKPLNQ
ncbi:MAG: hypothetical protein AAF152_01235 [Cyanobacteria bacterium P01_A01_bin.114]